MAVLNPPRTLPGLGRAVVNYLLEARRTLNEDELLATFKPEGLNPCVNAGDGLLNTISSLRAINVLRTDGEGALQVGDRLGGVKAPLDTTQFRLVLQEHVFDLRRDGDVWVSQPGDGHTSGARDLNRALTWVLAQDALGQPLSWTDNVQTLQAQQFSTSNNESWPISNDTRWLANVRWAIALGLATPSVMKDKSGVVPLPVVAVADAISRIAPDRYSVRELLANLGGAVPVLHGGVLRTGLVSVLGSDPDPGVAQECADSSVGQSLRILEDQGKLQFETLPDAEGIRLSRFDATRQTHVIVKAGGKN